MTDEYAIELYEALQEDARSPRQPVDVAALQRQVEWLSESYNAAMAHIIQEDVNWTRIFGGEVGDIGRKLDEIKDASKVIREFVIDAPLIGRAADLRQSYIHGKGMVIEGVEKTGKAGAPTALQRFFNNDDNQQAFFGEDAKATAETALGTDGVFLLLGDIATKTLEQIALSEIQDVLLHPVFPGKIMAYLREWTDYSTPKAITKRRWYYTDRAPKELRRKSISFGGGRVDVDPGKEIIDLPVNRQVGWPLGVPDLFAAVGWNRTYVRAIKNGVSVTDAMGMIAYKATAGSQKGADNMALRLQRGGSGKARVAITGVAQDIEALPTTGRAYDFGELRPLAAFIATAAKVSIVHLLSDPGAAGSSYGSASNLDNPTLKAMQSRQKTWVAYTKRLIKWATGDGDVKVVFPPIDDPDPIREMQVVATAWGTGLVHEEEARPRVLAAAGIERKETTAPDGVLLPNNEKSLARKDIDTDAAGGNPGNGGDFVGTQGSGAANSNTNAGQIRDNRGDVLSNSLVALQNTDFLDRFEALVERMERARDTD